nr:unnamed protein product [Digitaria exilis]
MAQAMSASVWITATATLTYRMDVKVHIDECALRNEYPDLQKDYPCSNNGICVNKLGGYDCPCRPGMKGDGKNGTCTEQFPLPAKVVAGKLILSTRSA